MDRLLLLMTTTTYKAQSFLDAAARLEVPVVVASERRQALQASNPAGHLTLDFDALDAAADEIAAFARRHPITAVVAADDDGVLLAARAGAALGLHHNPPASVLAARNKLLTREALVAAGLRAPDFRTCSLEDDPLDVATDVPYPCVLKPLHLSASRGVIRADDAGQFVTAFQRLGRILRQRDVSRAAHGLGSAGRQAARRVLIESFIPGVEVALEGVLTDGDLRVLALFDKPDPLDGPFFQETIYVTPSRLPGRVQEEIAAVAQRAIAALGLRTGPVHAELRWNVRGAWLLEIAPRSIGGLCSRALRFAGGVSLEELLLRHALGRDVSELTREAPASGVMMLPIPHAGILRAVAGQEEAARVPGVDEVRMTIPPGHPVVPPPEGARYLGFLFARAETPQQAEAALRAAHACLRIDIEPAETDADLESIVAAAARRAAV